MYLFVCLSTHPSFCYSQIINGVRAEINRLYDAFCSRNPSFAEKHGKVSILAHSLGSVITYDILSLWDIEQRHLSEDDLPTGFLTESFTYLRRLTSGENLETSESASDVSRSSSSHKVTSPSKKGKNKRKENIRVELAKARSNVMELEAMLKLTMEPENKDKESSSQEPDCPYALRFKVCYVFQPFFTILEVYFLFVLFTFLPLPVIPCTAPTPPQPKFFFLIK